MKAKIFTLLLIFSIQLLEAQNYFPKLEVLNPKAQWQKDIASIEDAQIIVRPKGVYMEYNIYLTYSAVSTSLNKTTDTTEIVQFFNLPKNALVTDSWLWVENTIVKADILDRWTASQIYEGIVKRNQDPSILKKLNANTYEFRIFPLPGGKTRKVKLTILTPISFVGNRASAPIPVNLMSLSKIALKNFNLKIPTVGTWSNPKIDEISNLNFTAQSNTIIGNFLEATIPYTKQNNMTISFDNPMKEGVYVAKYQSGKNNFYAMAIQPSIVQYTAEKSKKITIALAHDDFETSTKWQTLVSNLKNLISTTFNPSDSFNIVFNGLKPKTLSAKWIGVDAVSIEAAFKTLSQENISDANLPGVLAESIEYHKKAQGDAIVLCAATDQHATIQKANTLLSNLEKSYPNLPIIHVIDYNDYGASYYWNSSTSSYYYGNEYFYNLLTQKTGGNYGTWRSTNNSIKLFNQYASEVFNGLNGLLKNFDLYTTLSNGYCHSRMNIGSTLGSIVSLNQTIVQTGKFEGTFPMSIQIAGEYNNQSFFKNLQIPDADIVASDSTIGQIWTGAYLSSNEDKIGLPNAAIKDLIDHSIKKRVLSTYTAFLALEPGMLDTKPCSSCKDETIKATAIEDIRKDSVSIKVYPNPFREKISIEVNLSKKGENQTIRLEILNLSGQIVHQDQFTNTSNEQETFTWEAEQMPKGMYIARIKIGEKIYTIKLIKIE